MRKTFCSILILLCTTAFPLTLQAQGSVGVAGHVGTLGVGADVALEVAPNLGVRAGANIMPLEIDGTVEDVDFTIELQSPQFMALVDLYPAGGFRFSGGLRFSSSDIVLTGDVTETIELGDTDYDLESFVGTIVTKDVAPYFGIGFGNPAAGPFGFFFDLGVAYQGEPELDFVATGTATTLPGFDADLEEKRVEVEDELQKYFKFYPVISIGVSIGF